jgi:hypothetical protein
MDNLGEYASARHSTLMDNRNFIGTIYMRKGSHGELIASFDNLFNAFNGLKGGRFFGFGSDTNAALADLLNNLDAKNSAIEGLKIVPLREKYQWKNV